MYKCNLQIFPFLLYILYTRRKNPRVFLAKTRKIKEASKNLFHARYKLISNSRVLTLLVTD